MYGEAYDPRMRTYRVRIALAQSGFMASRSSQQPRSLPHNVADW